MVAGDLARLGSDRSAGTRVAILRDARRIAVVGPGGAGKTTFAAELGQLLDLPVIHLDRRYYASGWSGLDESTWAAVQRELVRSERWIMDGNYARPMETRLAAADAIVFLDLAAPICAVRMLRRWRRSLRVQPPDLPQGMRHRINRKMLWYGLLLRRCPVPPSLVRLEGERASGVVPLRSRREVGDLLERLQLGEA